MESSSYIRALNANIKNIEEKLELNGGGRGSFCLL